jgi:Sporulation and spore germination
MPRHWKIAIAILVMSVVAGLLTFPALLRNVLRLQNSAATEEQARREIVQPEITTPTDAPVSARLFWASDTQPGTLAPSDVQLSLSTEPVQRAKQLIAALITRAPSPVQRTLPADTVLLQFYLLPDGTAIADFSEAISGGMPSGILSEQMAVDSITRTLQANLSAATRLKILIRGQEVETLAGHLDLTGFFPLAPPTPLPDATPAADAAPAADTAPPPQP